MTAAELRAATLRRVLWGVQNGSLVELRPTSAVTLADARAHVARRLGAAPAGRVVLLPPLREHRIQPVAALATEAQSS